MPTLDHVTVAASDFGASVVFYDAALGALGFLRLAELVDEEEDEPAVEAVAWGAAGGVPILWLVSGAASSGLHVCLRAEHRDQVEAFFAAGTQAGGFGHAAPRRWTPYRRGDFTATLRDPDGNLIEAVGPE